MTKNLKILSLVLVFVLALSFGVSAGKKDVLVNLTPLFNNDGISYFHDPLDGDLNFNMQSLPAEKLPEAKEIIKYQDVRFLFPPKADGKKNNVAAYNQEIKLPQGKYYNIYLLTTATNGPQEEVLKVNYADGSSASVDLKVSSGMGGAIFGEQKVLSVDYIHGVEGKIERQMNLWVVKLDLDPAKELVSVKLPENPDIHIFAMTLGRKKDLVTAEKVIEKELYTIKDPEGDDYGPGSYVYPLNEVFKPGTFDITEVKVVEANENIIFKVRVNGEIGNAWGAPNGFSVHMIHIYLDNKNEEGVTRCIPGANVAFAEENAWDKAILAEGGWGNEVEQYLAEQAPELEDKVYIEHSGWVEGRVINIPVPKDFVKGFDSTWGIQVLMMGQEGSKQSMDGIKVRRVVKAEKSDWQFGGGDASKVHPNTIDILVPEGSEQTEILRKYLKTGEYSVVPLIYPEI